MVVIEKNFAKNKAECLKLLKNLQKATRTLKRICNEVKISDLVAMCKHVPSVTKCMEDLLVRVKAMCVANNCPQVFEVALLKNKTVKGDTIPEVEEQEENDDDDEGEEEEEEEEDICLSESEEEMNISGDLSKEV